jgi:peroxiredoxin
MKKLLLLFPLSFAVLALLRIDAAHADTKAQALLHRVEAAERNVRTLTADVTRIDMDGKVVEAALRAMKPNYLSIVYKQVPPGGAPAYVASDGKKLWRYPDPEKAEYKIEPTEQDGRGAIDWPGGVPIQALFGLKTALNDGGLNAAAFQYDGVRTWEEQSFQILRHDFEEDGKRYTAWLYIGSDDLIHRLLGTYYIPGPDGSPKMFEIALDHLQVNLPMQASQFAYIPPSGTRPAVARPLLPPGALAPDFTVEDTNGSMIRLSDLRGKVVVLDFWATWCLPCIRGMAHTNSVAADFKERGVVVLAVNVMDSREAFRAWLEKHPEYGALAFTFDPSPPGKDLATVAYAANSTIPTQYVIDRNGKIVTSLVGYRGPTPELAKGIKRALLAK